MAEQEEFKTIPDFESYEINNLGIIRNKYTKHKLEYIERENGHYQAQFTITDCLGKQNYVLSVHRTVYRLFSNESENIDNFFIDHKDQDPKNNYIKNLRLATPQQNMYNRRKDRNSSSIFKGVYYNKQRKRWQAGIQLRNKRQKNLGRYKYEYNAGLAYDIVARHIHGDFYKNQNFNEFEGVIPESDEGARHKAQCVINSLV